MSYCRFSKDSSAYMYPDVGGFIVCVGCSLNRGKDAIFFFRSGALRHLRRHRLIPQFAFDLLEKEIKEIGNSAEL